MNCLFLQSGGTTQVLNAALAGFLEANSFNEFFKEIYSCKNGFEGVLEDFESNKIVFSKTIDVPNVFPSFSLNGDLNLYNNNGFTKKHFFLSRIKFSPGSSITTTSRIKILEEEDFKKLEVIFKKYKITHLVNCGGNGTIKQSKSLSAYFGDSLKIINIPKTIDNDLGDQDFEKMLFTPGYPSCINFWISKTSMLLNELAGAYHHDKVIVAQTFGRETSFISATPSVSFDSDKFPILTLFPEQQSPRELILEAVRKKIDKFGRCLIFVPEGYPFRRFKFAKDLSNQIMWSSSESSIMQELINFLVKNKIQARGYYPSFDQRQDTQYAPKFDFEISREIGYRAHKALYAGASRALIGINSSAVIHLISFDEIENYSREMKPEWIEFNQEQSAFTTTQKFKDYLKTIWEVGRKFA